MEPLLDGHAIKDPSISALLLVPNACMLGCFNHSSISQVSEKACMQVTALCLNWLSRTCVAGLSPWAASVALQGQSLWDFLCLSLFSFSDVLLRPGKSAGSGKKRACFLCSAVLNTGL